MKTIKLLETGLLFSVFTAIVVNAEEFTQQNNEYAEREERHLKTIAKYSSDSSAEAIEKLGEIVGRLSRDPVMRESQALKQARERLLEIPASAEHFKQKILTISAWENGESTVQTYGSRGWFFQILTQLPHPETIRVLGEFLQDDRDPSNGVVLDTRYVTNSVNAAFSLHGIGLKKPPVGGRYGNARKDLPTWRLWYEQVQHGKPFSFEGDPRIYTLADKSQTSRTREERRPKSGERSLATDSRDRSSRTELLIVIGLLLLTVIFAATRIIRKSGKSSDTGRDRMTR
jgi:hypothetical protein